MSGDIDSQGLIYIELDRHGLDQIRPLWEKLIEHIRSKSIHFKGFYETRRFEERKEELLAKSDGDMLHIDLAVEGGRYIGYCISSISCRAGEIDSIFVEESHRSAGVGSGLMNRALRRLEAEGAEEIKLFVASGNEEVFQFYGRHGFLAVRTQLNLIVRR